VEEQNIQVIRREDPLRDFHARDGHFIEKEEDGGTDRE